MADWLLAHGAGQLGGHHRTQSGETKGEKLARFGAAVSRFATYRRTYRLEGGDERIVRGAVGDAGWAPRIFHAAGISIPQDLPRRRPRQLRPGAEAEGGRRLAAPWCPWGWNLEFFAMCSTIACVWGSQHIASYAAANQFLDGLAAYRHALGLPALVVDWGLWAGAVVICSTRKCSGFLKSVGLKPLAPAQGIGLLARLLGSDVGHQVIAGVDWARFKALRSSRGARPAGAHRGRGHTDQARRCRGGPGLAAEAFRGGGARGASSWSMTMSGAVHANLLGVKVEQVRAKLEDGGSLVDYGLSILCW
ncbi:KR domain-containing protein [Pseudomonas aeruginosa]